MSAAVAPAGGTGRAGPGAVLRFALRDLRGGLRGFRVLLACLALGVGTIAAVGSLAGAVRDGLARDARTLLGGDLDIRATHRPATPQQLAWIEARAELSAIATTRAMAARVDGTGRGRALVELKAVDRTYPLFGNVTLAPQMPLGEALAQAPDGAFGAVVEEGLRVRLRLALGDRIHIGATTFVVNAQLRDEPDKGSGAFKLGPRVIISTSALIETGLIQPGSLVRYHYRLRYPPGTDGRALEAALEEQFPTAPWRVRNADEAAPRIQRFIARAALFLTLVGLTALLVGGIGVAGAVKAHLDGRRETIATLKCLGATGGFVFAVFAIEIAVMAAIGIVLGLAAGAALPAVLVPMLGPYLPAVPGFGLQPAALAAAAAYGIAVAVLFTLWPLARAREVPAAALFRSLVAETPFRPRPSTLAGLGLAGLAIAVLAVATAFRPSFALWFIAGAVAAFAAFHGASLGLGALARRSAQRLTLRGHSRPRLQLALANIARPGAPCRAIVLSFGIGLTLFVALAQIEGNFQRQIAERLPEVAPAYFFIDIQPDQVAAFEDTVRSVPGTGAIQRLPSLRGRIIRAGGRPIDEIEVGPGARWAVDSDRGLTYAARMPGNADIVAGSWWPEDYAGPPLLSLDARIAEGLGVGLGDTLTINVLGREITAQIANLRHIDWGRLGLNFTMIFSPGTLEGAPQTHIATVRAAPAAEETLARAVTDRFANVSAIRVREALEAVAHGLSRIGAAARATAALALIAGVLVLAGAMAAGRRERTRDAVILKVTGARRRDLALAYLVEYGLAGLAAAALAALLGTVAAFLVLTRVMHTDWVFLPVPAAVTIAAATGAVILMGFAGTWRALARRPAPVLRENAA